MVAKTNQYAGQWFIGVIRHDNRGIALLEHGINKLASSAKGLVEKMFPDTPSSMHSQEEFLSKFVAIVILFSFSGTGIFGAMNEGMTGDFDILIVKSFSISSPRWSLLHHLAFQWQVFLCHKLGSSDFSLFCSIYYSFCDTRNARWFCSSRRYANDSCGLSHL